MKITTKEVFLKHPNAPTYFLLLAVKILTKGGRHLLDIVSDHARHPHAYLQHKEPIYTSTMVFNHSIVRPMVDNHRKPIVA